MRRARRPARTSRSTPRSRACCWSTTSRACWRRCTNCCGPRLPAGHRHQRRRGAGPPVARCTSTWCCSTCACPTSAATRSWTSSTRKGIDADVIVMSGEVGIDAAIGALKRGAYDYLRKPYSREELLKTVANALQQRRLEADNERIATQLENSEKLYRYLVDSSPDIIYTLNHEGRFTFVNDRAYQLLGYTPRRADRQALLDAGARRRPGARALRVQRAPGRRARLAQRRAAPEVPQRQQPRSRTFNNTLMTISLNSIGMHVPDQEVQEARVLRHLRRGARHHRPQARRGSDLLPGLPRHPDRPAEPHPVQGPPGPGRDPGQAQGDRAGGDVHRPRPLQAGQRHARPRQGRRAAAAGARCA